MLYSLLHLGGFDGDLAFYRSHTAGASRILELGAGDGRMGAELSTSAEYVGVENCAEFLDAARQRITGTGSCILEQDMLAPLPEDTPKFEAAILTANTFFCTPQHSLLLDRCREALAPGGTLLFDVYNAAPWHEDALSPRNEAGEEATNEEDLLVKAIDVEGREWSVFERDAEVNTAQQQIICSYDFQAASGERTTQTNVHHYALPAQLHSLLHAAGFEVLATYGGFGDEPFDEDESEHLIFEARLR